MRLLFLVAATAGAAAVAWYNPGNLMGKVGLQPLQPAQQPAPSASVSKWKDANGRTVYGDAGSAPAGSQAQTVKLAAPNLVSMPKAPPPAAGGQHGNHTAAEVAAANVDGAMPLRPQPRNLAIERMEATFSGKPQQK